MRKYEKVWEAGKARCAGRRAAPASHTLGIARRPRTISEQLAATLPYTPILSHTLSYSPIKQPPSIPLPAYAANNKKKTAKVETNAVILLDELTAHASKSTSKG